MIEKFFYDLMVFKNKISKYFNEIEKSMINNIDLKNIRTIPIDNLNINLIRSNLVKTKKEHVCDYCDRSIDINEICKKDDVILIKKNKMKNIYLCFGCLISIFLLNKNRTK